MSSKPVFRHVSFKNTKKKDAFQGVPVSDQFASVSVSGSGLVAASLRSSGGGKCGVYAEAGRISAMAPVVQGHSGSVTVARFSNYHSTLLATASEDGSVCVWDIPAGGLTAKLCEPLVQVNAHSRSIVAMEWHPSCAGVLFTASADKTLCVWDIMAGTLLCDLQLPAIPLSGSWSPDGALVGLTLRDKTLFVVDPRTPESGRAVVCHGTIRTRVCWLGGHSTEEGHCLVTTGSTSGKREIKFWRAACGAEPVLLSKQSLDTSSGVIVPLYDIGTRLLFLADVGSSTIPLWEVMSPSSPFFIGKFSVGQMTEALCIAPRRLVNADQKEVVVVYQSGREGVWPCVVSLPTRRGGSDDPLVYPPVEVPDPAMNVAEYSAGSNSIANTEPFGSSCSAAKAVPVSLSVSPTTAATADAEVVRALQMAQAEAANQKARADLLQARVTDLEKMLKTQTEAKPSLGDDLAAKDAQICALNAAVNKAIEALTSTQ
ncbi:coronin [Kipferlia bialata]|uniref:Coronin n=1 Tax=Kipferlia bialata TaxID=797122 RepID=A0A9K3CYA9_9EUKA|nr:coronin [Kipferlia bialata]|eukprot:g6060.t1